jgi:hypothetical protein
MVCDAGEERELYRKAHQVRYNICFQHSIL